jgi:phytoene dehydrogenase-like protein
VRTRAEVTEIATRRGRVLGVRLAGGESVPGRVVIADVMPAALARLAGAGLPGPYARGLRRYRPGPPTLKVDWALAGPIPWRSPEARLAGTVHVGGSESELLAGSRGAPSPTPFMLLGQQSLADRTRAPAGGHTAWAYTHSAADSARGLGAEDVTRMEAAVERLAPGFGALILARHVLAPADLQARNRNLVAGDVGGGSYALDQLIFRPGASLIPYRTPVRGLYLGSAATFPGAAVHGVCGRAAARLALAEARLRRI